LSYLSLLASRQSLFVPCHSQKWVKPPTTIAVRLGQFAGR
jgi:hypothetical protein